ncbi:hypothetical protein [Pontibacterium sp.]|uniref:hypothetical protein n=1 Tax=Pontibacterium sp. TaxID=2036026 RepID=UPI003567D497
MPELPFEYIRQSLYFFRSHLPMILRIQLPFLLLVNFLALFVDGPIADKEAGVNQGVAALTLLNMTLLPVYTAATIMYFSSVVNDRPITAGQAIMLGVSRWWALLLVFIFSGFAIFSGLLFLIIPGLFIMMRLAFADYICVTEQKGPVQALKESWERTQDYFWILLNGLAILFVVISGTEMALEMVLRNADSLDGPIRALINIVFSVLNTVITVYAFRIYCIQKDKLKPVQPPQTPDDSQQPPV